MRESVPQASSFQCFHHHCIIMHPRPLTNVLVTLVYCERILQKTLSMPKELPIHKAKEIGELELSVHLSTLSHSDFPKIKFDSECTDVYPKPRTYEIIPIIIANYDETQIQPLRSRVEWRRNNYPLASGGSQYPSYGLARYQYDRVQWF